MPKKSLEEMKESEEICNYCVYGETKMLGISGGAPVFCEGLYCDDAYAEYMAEQ